MNSGRCEREKRLQFPFPKRAILSPLRATAGCLEGVFTFTGNFPRRAARLDCGPVSTMEETEGSESTCLLPSFLCCLIW